jgi:hypothetical protein
MEILAVLRNVKRAVKRTEVVVVRMERMGSLAVGSLPVVLVREVVVFPVLLVLLRSRDLLISRITTAI